VVTLSARLLGSRLLPQWPIGFVVAMVALPTLMASAAYAGTPSWTIQTTPNPGTVNLLAGVSCSSPGACTAVGGYTDPSGNALTLAERFASPAAFSPRHRA
jgi:hypothetical protein